MINYLLLGVSVAAILGVVLFRVFAGGGQTPPDGAAGTVAGPRSEPVAIAPDQFNPAPPPQRKSPQDEAREKIAEYQKKIDAGPKSEETAALQYAMGNLYRQKLGDYAKAAECYEWFIQEYPDSPDLGKVFVQLGLCYEQLKQGEKLNRLYLDMSRRFPKDSQEYLYVKEKLGW